MEDDKKIDSFIVSFVQHANDPEKALVVVGRKIEGGPSNSFHITNAMAGQDAIGLYNLLSGEKKETEQ